MGFVAAVIGGFMLLDAFDAKHFAVRQEWEAGIAIFLVIIGLIVGIFEGD